MKRKGWSVTFATATPESAEHGDYAATGFALENATFREALSCFGEHAAEADCWPISREVAPRWFDSSPETNYRTGAETIYSLHIPNCVTAASRVRLARVLGLKVGR